MLNCKILKREDSTYIITTDIAFQTKHSVNVSVSPEKFTELKKCSEQSELTFWYDLHGGIA